MHIHMHICVYVVVVQVPLDVVCTPYVGVQEDAQGKEGEEERKPKARNYDLNLFRLHGRVACLSKDFWKS